jgi:NAD(P)-dependent dehydrogenase (short-subunit alcohol dehydrogenase family)
MTRFEDRVALVTGGGTGIGRAIAVRLASEGARVVVTGRRTGPLEETVEAIRENGSGAAEITAGDVSSPEDAERMVAGTVSRFGSLSVLVNNAGVIRRDRPAGKTTPEEWTEQLDINLTGAFLVSRAALPHLRATGGAIVNVASVLGSVAVPGTAAYQASKAGLLGLTRSMAIDAAPEVRVNAVSPGLVHTPLSYQDRPDFDEHLAEFAEAHPLKRVGRPGDIAAAVAFLASREASWITGTNLTVDGGYTVT